MGAHTTIPSFTEEQTQALAAVLDEIVPPSSDGRLPGAGELGVAAYIEQALGKTPDLGPVVAGGLSTLGRLARARNVPGFAALSKGDRLSVLNELASADPAFVPTLTFLTYAGYYQSARVVEALGLEPRPPHPEGYEMEPNDLTLLDTVRRRSKMYREG